VGHDWGAIVAVHYFNLCPSRVKKLVQVDVGAQVGDADFPLGSKLVVVLYQILFATAYAVSQVLGNAVGSAMFSLILMVLPAVGPCYTFDKPARPFQELGVHMCVYQYAQEMHFDMCMHTGRIRTTTSTDT
jgi:pimeloyl-ACP methyl ester carboxylesterase